MAGATQHDDSELPRIPTRVEADAAPRAQYDPSYFERHDARNRPRIRAIMDHLTRGQRVLDIGCNRGYFSRAVLDLDLADQVEGVEPSRERVDPDLLENERFTLHAGDIFELELPHRYHAVIYCAVHHHVFGHRGRAAALQLWQRIVERCDRHIFFETGQLLEGSRWYWQRALRGYYPSDEQHIATLLQAAGPRLDGVKVIGRHMIHGTRRWLLRIDLTPPRERAAPAGAAEYEVLERFQRSVGSSRQRLVAEGADASGVTLHDGVRFARCRRIDGTMVWCKRSPAEPHKDAREHMIGTQVTDPRFVRPLELHPELGLVFPYVEGEKLSEANVRAAANRDTLLGELLDLFAYAEQLQIDTGELDLDPRKRGSSRALIDLIDLHPANMLVARDQHGLRLEGVIDLEYFRNDNRARNAGHMAELILEAGWRSPRALAFLAKAAAWQARDRLHWSLAPLEDRLYEGRGTELRKLVMRAREARDRMLKDRPGHWQ